MQDPIRLHGINVRETLGKIGGINILQIKPAGLIESFQMSHLFQTKRTLTVVIHAQRAGFWCIHGMEIPLLVQE